MRGLHAGAAPASATAPSRSCNGIQRHLTQRNLRLEALHQIIEKGEGLDFGTQNVLGGLDEPDRIKDKLNGIVASAIEVEPQFISAIEAALHDHLQAVLLTDSSLADEIIGKLNSGKLGRAALVPCRIFSTRRRAPTASSCPTAPSPGRSTG